MRHTGMADWISVIHPPGGSAFEHQAAAHRLMIEGPMIAELEPVIAGGFERGGFERGDSRVRFGSR